MHRSKLLEQLKYDEERCQHPLTYHFPFVSSTTKWSPQSGVAGKGLHDSLADKELYFRGLQRQENLTTLRSLRTAWKQFSCHMVTPQAPCTAQLCVLFVDKLQTAKTKPRSTKCTCVCCCLGWSWGGKKGTLTVRNHAKSTSSTIPIHLSPLGQENTDRMQAEVTRKVIFFLLTCSVTAAKAVFETQSLQPVLQLAQDHWSIKNSNYLWILLGRKQ